MMGGTGSGNALLGVGSIFDFILRSWSIGLQCNTVAEVQGFRSAWMGLANLLVVLSILGLTGGLLVVAAMTITALMHRP